MNINTSHNESRLLLLSSSLVYGMGYLEYVQQDVDKFLGTSRTLYFAPYAAPAANYDMYTARVHAALQPFGISVIGLHTLSEPGKALVDAEALYVGGGNTFRLLKILQQLDLIELVRDRTNTGALKYMGSSAGINVACPTIRTTNDMPVVEPASFAAFGFIPFQLNPHYLDPELGSKHMGETRAERIGHFHEENDVAVLGLREGAWLHKEGSQLLLGGLTSARLFKRQQDAQEFEPGTDLSWLLDLPTHFDVAS